MPTDPVVVQFHVIGEPKPKGSSRAFVIGGRAVITNDCKTAKPWEHAVHWAARERAQEVGLLPIATPVAVTVDFVMPRITSLAKKRLKVPHGKRPDLDKLTRNTLDALTGVIFLDDSQVSSLTVSKRYADPLEPPGATVLVRPVEVA